ncbi:MAG: GNAT family N-acetyltransferase [Pyrinomonadaceae bacterium]|nr:GNAT family N-acetyltransferase [Sphingobacteriaceae bacterium]
MEVLPISLDDIEELKELQPEGWPDIIPHFTFYINSSFCDPIKFIRGKRIIGIGCAIRYTSTAWLGHIIVHKEFRNQGLGSHITKTLVERLQNTGCKTISLIATDLGEPVYQKLGFIKETDYHFLKKEGAEILSYDHTLISHNATGFEEQTLLMDKLVWDEDRTLLLQPHLKDAKFCIENNKLKGFYLPTLGEGLIIATDSASGIELLKYRVETHNTAVLPAQNEAAIQFLLEINFKHLRTAARMRLGPATGFKAKMLFNRIGGNVG